MLLQLLVVTCCVYKRAVNPITNPNIFYIHYITLHTYIDRQMAFHKTNSACSGGLKTCKSFKIMTPITCIITIFSHKPKVKKPYVDAISVHLSVYCNQVSAPSKRDIYTKTVTQFQFSAILFHHKIHFTYDHKQDLFTYIINS
jgi:hypothetical protein